MYFESLNADVCCLSKTSIQDSSEVLCTRSSSIDSKSPFHLCLPEDSVESSSCFVGIRIQLSPRAEKTLIAIINQQLTVGLESFKVGRNRFEKWQLFISSYEQTDYRSNAIKDEFHHQLNILLKKSNSTYSVVLAPDLNSWSVCPDTEEIRLGGQREPISLRSNNSNHLL